MNKLLYLSQLRYPTEKAYGVTVGNTLSAARKIGLNAEILIWGKLETDEFGNELSTLARRPVRLPKSLFVSRNRLIAKLAFSLNQMIFGTYLAFNPKYRDKTSIFWTREPLTLLFHSILFKNSKYLIEIHHALRPANRLVVRFLNLRNQVQIIVLSEKSAAIHERDFPSIPVLILPMGVPDSFFLQEKKVLNQNFSVGYLGKGFSSGFDNKLEIIIEAAEMIQDLGSAKFMFIGLEPVYRSKLQKLVQEKNLNPSGFEFIDHIKHQEVPRYLTQLDVGILPYANSPYNEERFPIKILEYAASGLPIVATDTDVHRDLLDPKFTIFYSDGDPRSLGDAILKLKNNSNLHHSMMNTAQEFALKFKYDSRAIRLLQAIMNFR